jgi:pimeloyl-ACP methyl ester carboxylesterase
MDSFDVATYLAAVGQPQLDDPAGIGLPLDPADRRAFEQGYGPVVPDRCHVHDVLEQGPTSSTMRRGAAGTSAPARWPASTPGPSIRPPWRACARPLRIQGSASPSPVHHLVAHLAGVIPGATIATIAGADHLMPLTAPTEIGRLIGDFCGTPSIR